MAWTTPGTATAGEVLTAAFWNTNVRDNSLELNRRLNNAASSSGFATTATHTTFQDVGVSASVTYPANAIIKVTYATHGIANGGIQGIKWKFVRGSTDIRLFEITSSAFPDTSGACSFTFVAIFQAPAVGATETFKVQLAARTNNTAVSDWGAAAYPRQLLIEQLGTA